jgi:hypothetical protein
MNLEIPFCETIQKIIWENNIKNEYKNKKSLIIQKNNLNQFQSIQKKKLENK